MVVCHCSVPQLEFTRICFSTSPLFFILRRRPLSCTVFCRPTMPIARGNPVQQILFHGVMTPSLESVGPGLLTDVGDLHLSVSCCVMSHPQVQPCAVGSGSASYPGVWNLSTRSGAFPTACCSGEFPRTSSLALEAATALARHSCTPMS